MHELLEHFYSQALLAWVSLGAEGTKTVRLERNVLGVKVNGGS